MGRNRASELYLHDLVLEFGKEVVDDLVLLDGERVKVDLLHALDLAALHETAQLGDRHPFLVAVLGTTTSATSASTATASVAATVTSGTETSTGAASIAASVASVGHTVVLEIGSWEGGRIGRRGMVLSCEVSAAF